MPHIKIYASTVIRLAIGLVLASALLTGCASREERIAKALDNASAAITKDEPITPDFYDGLRNQQVLDAMQISAEKKTWIEVAPA